MKLFTQFIIAIAFIILAGCQKDMNNKSITATAENINDLKTLNGCTARWSSSWIAPYDRKSGNIGQHDLIQNGIAQVSPASVPADYYFTSVILNIPECETIDGDNLKFEAYLENPDSLPKANTDYDVSMFIAGSTDTAHVTFIGYRKQFTSLQVGSHGVTNSAKLLHLFEGWTKVTLVAKNHHLGVFLNDSLILKIGYSGSDIGQVKSISVDFKGSGKVESVKLINTQTNTYYLKEEFIAKEASFQ